MTARELPELPEPDIEVSGVYGYTDEQMHQYALDAIEKAAPRVSEGMVSAACAAYSRTSVGKQLQRQSFHEIAMRAALEAALGARGKE